MPYHRNDIGSLCLTNAMSSVFSCNSSEAYSKARPQLLTASFTISKLFYNSGELASILLNFCVYYA